MMKNYLNTKHLQLYLAFLHTSKAPNTRKVGRHLIFQTKITKKNNKLENNNF